MGERQTRCRWAGRHLQQSSVMLAAASRGLIGGRIHAAAKPGASSHDCWRGLGQPWRDATEGVTD